MTRCGPTDLYLAWANAVSRLIREALGDTPAEVFMDDGEDRLSADRNATKEQAWLDNRLRRLGALRQTVESREAVPFRSGFDLHGWKDWKSPPRTSSEEPERLMAKLREAERRCEVLRSEKAALEEQNERLRSQPDRELQQRCLRLSDELFAFANERDKHDPQKNPQHTAGTWRERNREKTRHDNETTERYGQQFAGRAKALLDAAQERRWIAHAERKSLEENVKGTFRLYPPTAYIQEMAQRLAGFGHKL